jgi:hypothetical protein
MTVPLLIYLLHSIPHKTILSASSASPGIISIVVLAPVEFVIFIAAVEVTENIFGLAQPLIESHWLSLRNRLEIAKFFTTVSLGFVVSDIEGQSTNWFLFLVEDLGFV